MFGRTDQQRSFCGLLSALFVLAISCVGFASSTPENTVHFAWVRGVGAESCPNEATLAKIIAARLGRNPFSRESSWFIEGVVEHADVGWSAHIRMSKDGTILGTRELSSETVDCSAITAASVLAIAIGIDPDAALISAPKSEPSAPPVPKQPPPLKPKDEARPPIPKPAPPLVRPAQPLNTGTFPRVAFSSQGVLGFALLPRIAPGFALAASVEGQRWEGALGMLWLPEVPTANREFAFGITAVSLAGCVYPFRWRRLSPAGCLAGYAGGIHQVVLPPYEPTNVGQRAWFAAAPSIRARYLLVSWLSVDAGVEFVIPLLRHDFAVQERSEPVFSMGALGIATFFGPSLSIP